MDVSNLIQMTPWDRYAGVCGALTTIVCLLIGFVALFVNDGAWHVFAALYTVGVGFLVAVIELPALYCHSYACIKLKDRLIEDTSFHHGWIRASLCGPPASAARRGDRDRRRPQVRRVHAGDARLQVDPHLARRPARLRGALRFVSIKYRISSGRARRAATSTRALKVATADAGAEEEGPSFGTFTL
ncbi:hypothetical protein JL722_12919 [Aureococcus anophagefferens]|nr:hypothetical protein JL722_12919 [Aureococcus anophagefferens]